jgi:hypothetical protein
MHALPRDLGRPPSLAQKLANEPVQSTRPDFWRTAKMVRELAQERRSFLWLQRGADIHDDR